MGILSFILGNKNLIILAIVASVFAGGAIYIKILKSDLATAVAEKNTKIAELQVSQASVKSLTEAVKTQNEAIDKLKADSDARFAKHEKELKTAKYNADLYLKHAQYLMSKQPPEGKDKCEAANDLINQEIQNVK